MTKSDSGQQRNNQPTKGSAKAGGGGCGDSDGDGSGEDGDAAARRRRNGNGDEGVLSAWGWPRPVPRANIRDKCARGRAVRGHGRDGHARADEICNSLSREYNNNINNRAGEWALVHEEYAFNPNVSSFVPDEDILVAIGKRLGERILARKRRDFDVANIIRDKLCDKYVVEINNQNKDWMMVAPRGGRWPKDSNGERDESDIVSREEWEEGGDKDGGSPSP